VRQISGKRKTHHIRYLITENGTRIDDPWKMANELATQFTKTSDNTQYTPRVQKKKGQRREGTDTAELRKRRTIQQPAHRGRDGRGFVGLAGTTYIASS
jgi:hypothetical protein